MPINWELDFVQPIMSKIQNGDITSTDEYALVFAEQFEKAVSKGAPVGIPPTMPSPAASGAPVPVGTGLASDGYSAPFDLSSQQRMYKAISSYYTARQIIINKEDLKSNRDTINLIRRKMRYQKNRIKAFKRESVVMSKLIGELPIYVQNLIEFGKLLYKSYKEQMQNVLLDLIPEQIRTEIEQLEGLSAEDKRKQILERGVEELTKLFPEEMRIYKIVTELQFDDIQAALDSVRTIERYISQAERFTSDPNATKAYFNRRIITLTKDIQQLAKILQNPFEIENILKTIQPQDPNVKAKLKDAREAYDNMVLVRTVLEPRAAALKGKIKEVTNDVENNLSNKLETQLEAFQRKMTEQLKTKNTVQRKNLFKQATDDAKQFKDQINRHASNIKTVGANAKNIIRDASRLTQDVLSIKVEIENEYTTIKKELKALEERVGQFTKRFEDVNLDDAKIDLKYDPPSKDTLVGGKRNIKNDINEYVKGTGIGDFATPLIELMQGVSVDIDSLRIYFETPKESYGRHIATVNGLINSVKNIENNANSLIKSIQNSGVGIKKREGKKPKSLPIKPIDPKPVTLIKLFKKFEELKAFLDRVKAKVEDFLSQFVERAKDQIEKAKTNIETFVRESKPVSGLEQSLRTKKQHIEDKINIYEDKKRKAVHIAKLTSALSKATTSGAAIVGEISAGNILSAELDKPIKQFAEAKFTYQTINKSADSPEYQKAATDRRRMEDIGDSVKALTILTDMLVTTFTDLQQVKEVKNTFGKLVEDNFFKELKEVIDQMKSKVQVNEGGILGITQDAKTIRLSAAIRGLSEIEAPTNAGNIINMVRAIRELKSSVTSGKNLSELFNATDIALPLQALEQKYLERTAFALKAILGDTFYDYPEPPDPRLVAAAEEQGLKATIQPQPGAGESEPIKYNFKEEYKKVGSGAEDKRAEDFARESIAASKAIAKQRLRKLKIAGVPVYELLLDLSKTLKGGGSFIAKLIDKILEGLDWVESWITQQISKFVEPAKQKIEDLKDQAEEEVKRRLEGLNIKKMIDSLIVFRIVYSIANRLYWTGASWTNSAGTKFQVLNIGRFPKLKISGMEEGAEAHYREVADALQKQMDNMLGLCIPNPATGIPPFTFKGYK